MLFACSTVLDSHATSSSVTSLPSLLTRAPSSSSPTCRPGLRPPYFSPSRASPPPPSQQQQHSSTSPHSPHARPIHPSRAASCHLTRHANGASTHQPPSGRLRAHVSRHKASRSDARHRIPNTCTLAQAPIGKPLSCCACGWPRAGLWPLHRQVACC